MLNSNSKKHLGVFALYTDRARADRALKTLKKYGISKKDVSVLSFVKDGNKDFVYQQSTSVVVGALSGAVLGFTLLGGLGFFFGLFTLLWSSALGLFFGAAGGALVGIGCPRAASKRYEFYLDEGGTVLVAHLREGLNLLRLNKILEMTSGQDIQLLNEEKFYAKFHWFAKTDY